MQPGGSMPHSQGLYNNPYPEPNQTNSSYWCLFLRSILILPSHLRIGLLSGIFPVGLPDNIFKPLLPFSILITCIHTKQFIWFLRLKPTVVFHRSILENNKTIHIESYRTFSSGITWRQDFKVVTRGRNLTTFMLWIFKAISPQEHVAHL